MAGNTKHQSVLRLTGESGLMWEMARGIFWSTPPWWGHWKHSQGNKNCWNKRHTRRVRPTLTLKPNLPSWSGVMQISIRSPSRRLPFTIRENHDANVPVEWFDDWWGPTLLYWCKLLSPSSSPMLSSACSTASSERLLQVQEGVKETKSFIYCIHWSCLSLDKH